VNGLQILELEERDRRGYEARPQEIKGAGVWERAAVWPED
jgi:hypothetical protein